jgi:hypothetical protein
MRKATSLNDFTEESPLIFSKEDIKDGVQKFIKSFGSFNRTGLHRFYEKAGIATISWEQKNLEDGTVEPLKYGKVVGIVNDNCTKGSKIWKNYEAKTDSVFDFWEEFYRQANKLIAKEEWVEKQQLLALQKTADEIGVI